MKVCMRALPVIACCTLLALSLPRSAAFIPLLAHWRRGTDCGSKQWRVREGAGASIEKTRMMTSPAHVMLVTNKMCPFAQKTWICLEEKKAAHGVEYKLEEIGLCELRSGLTGHGARA